MHVTMIEGEFADNIRKACYDYLIEKYRREKWRVDRHLCEGEHRRTGEKRIQFTGSAQGVSEEGRDDGGDGVRR
jgi:hypothetical protein